MLVLVFPYPVSANVYWRTFVVGRRAMTVPSDDAKAYKADVARIARNRGITKPIIGRVHVDIELYPQRPQDWVKRARANPTGWDDDVRCIDIDNARKCLYDAMRNIVFEDDKWVWSDSAKRMEPDGDARVVVKISEVARAALPVQDMFEGIENVRHVPRVEHQPEKAPF